MNTQYEHFLMRWLCWERPCWKRKYSVIDCQLWYPQIAPVCLYHQLWLLESSPPPCVIFRLMYYQVLSPISVITSKLWQATHYTISWLNSAPSLFWNLLCLKTPLPILLLSSLQFLSEIIPHQITCIQLLAKALFLENLSGDSLCAYIGMTTACTLLCTAIIWKTIKYKHWLLITGPDSFSGATWNPYLSLPVT